MDSMTESDFSAMNPGGFSAADNHILVVMGRLKEKSEAGIVYAKAVQPEPGVGIVVSVGYGVERISVGDRVTWKDTMTFMGSDKAVTNDASVFVGDRKNLLVAVRKDMVIAIRKAVKPE